MHYMGSVATKDRNLIYALLVLISFFIPWIYASYEYHYYEGYIESFHAILIIFGFGPVYIRFTSNFYGLRYSGSDWTWMWKARDIYVLGLISFIFTIVYCIIIAKFRQSLTVAIRNLVVSIGVVAFILGLIYGGLAIYDAHDWGYRPIPLGFISFLVMFPLSLIRTARSSMEYGVSTMRGWWW